MVAIKYVGTFVVLSVLLSACQAAAELIAMPEEPANVPQETATPGLSAQKETPLVEKTILALGDSYTIGTRVTQDERWPLQLAAALRKEGIPAAEPLIIAQGGWTTEDLAAGIRDANPQGPFDLVTLLIGVNDQFRGNTVEEYRPRFTELLAQAIDFAGGDPGRVIVLSIPDWSVTPFANGRRTTDTASEIDAFNAANLFEAQEAGVHYVDVTAISRLAGDKPDLLASDGLHPSGDMYALWVEELLPLAKEILGQER